MSVLVVAEHDGERIRLGSRSAISVGRDIAAAEGRRVEVLVAGCALDAVSAEAMRFGTTIVADSPALRFPTADRFARLIADVCAARSTATVVAASTTFAKDVLPRAAAIWGATMVSEVIDLRYEEGELFLRRPMYAGAITATVRLRRRPRVITVRASAFSPARPAADAGDVTRWMVDEAALPRQIQYVGIESRATDRPEISEARVVVSGGRPFQTSEEFEKYVGRLADVLGGATGCTRPLVDAGIAPNEWQVGQTGKVVAPELYVALGVSGAVQHLAGMKNSRVVVAVNSDPNAPIFSFANYGLVGDVRVLVPQLIEQLAKED